MSVPKVIFFVAFFVYVLGSHISAADPVEVRVVYGFKDRSGKSITRFDKWAPVFIEFTYNPKGAGKLFDAEIRLHVWTDHSAFGEAKSKPFYYSRKVHMGPGRKAFFLYHMVNGVRSVDGKVEAELGVVDLATGKEIKRIDITPQVPADPVRENSDFIILTLGHDNLGLGVVSLLQEKQDKLHEELVSRLQVAERHHLRDVVCDYDTAPDSFVGFEMVDAVVWDSPEPGKLRPAQLAALREWIMRGGRLVVTFPVGKAVPDMSAIADILPAKVAGKDYIVYKTKSGKLPVREKNKIVLKNGVWKEFPPDYAEALCGEWQFDYYFLYRHPFMVTPVLKGDADGFYALRLDLVDGKRMLPFDKKYLHIIMAEKAYGLGTVVMLAPDLSQKPFANHPGKLALLGRVLGISLDGENRRRVDSAVSGSRINRWRPTGSSTYKVNDADVMALEYLSKTPRLKPVPLVWILLFFAVYVAVVGPVDFFLLRRIDKLRWTWFSFFFYVAAFACLAYYGAYWFRGGKSFARAVEIRDEYPGAGLVARHDFFGLFSARSEGYDVDFGSNALPVAMGELTYRSEENMASANSGGSSRVVYPYDGMSESISFGSSVNMHQVPVRKWAMKYFYGKSHAKSSVSVSGTLYYDGIKLLGTIKNVSDTTLMGAMVIGRFGVVTIGDVTPGESWSADSEKGNIEFLAYCSELATHSRSWNTDDSLDDVNADEGGESEERIKEGLRIVESMSFKRLVWDWQDTRRVIRKLQFTKPRIYSESYFFSQSNLSISTSGLNRGDFVRDYVYKGGASLREVLNNPRPPIGLSVEQLWSIIAKNVDDKYLADLSVHILRGGIVLIAGQDKTPDCIGLKGREIERKGFTVVRVIFPVAPHAKGGDIWQDDIYGKLD